MAQTHPPPTSGREHRSRLVLGLLSAYFALQIGALAVNLSSLDRVSAGFAYHVHVDGVVHVFPITPAAARAVSGAGETQLALISINGVLVGAPGMHVERIDAALQLREGALNRFVLEAPGGQRLEARLLAQQLTLYDVARAAPESVLFPLVGLLYVALGVIVWWRRPNDRGSAPLLLFALVPGTHLTFNLYANEAARQIEFLSQSVPPLYGPLLLNLALQFTGFYRRRVFRTILRVSFGVALVLVAANLVAWSQQVVLEASLPYRAALGGSVLAALLLTVGLSFAASRAPHPLPLRRRARALGLAALLCFFFPTLTLFMPVGRELTYLTLAQLAAFPALIGYAIVRLGMFDIRVVFGQGLIYLTLSVTVLLAYLLLVALAFHGVGATADRPFLAGAIIALSVLVLSLVQVRVQGGINRLVFRSRYLLGDALAQASHTLLRARSTKEALETLRVALLDTMQLSCAAVAVRRAGEDVLRCRVVGARTDPITGELPAPLPERLDPARYRPIARALASEEPISTHDSQVASAILARDARSTKDGTDEATFWTHHGIEWIVPIRLRQADSGERIPAGVLLLGPKQNGRAFDRSDRALMVTLANQLSVAIDNTFAFEEIQRLKDNLEATVEERTRDLSRALSELRQTQGQLVESEMQAMLGRVVAGIVHEVNSPLGSLRSSIDTTERLLMRLRDYIAAHAEAGDDAAKKLLSAVDSGNGLIDVMQQSGDRIHGLVESLKRFVNLDEQEMRPLDVREGIDSALTLLSPLLGSGIAVHRCYPERPPIVLCYPARLNQVFLNVIENAANAVDGVESGEVRIGVSNGNGRVEVEVADNGRGIEPDRVHSLLDVGFTNKQGRVRMRLGLPGNRRTVEELGGELTIHSQPGEGTTVRIALPA